LWQQVCDGMCVSSLCAVHSQCAFGVVDRVSCPCSAEVCPSANV
jgi:hypothetical protein